MSDSESLSRETLPFWRLGAALVAGIAHVVVESIGMVEIELFVNRCA